MQISDFRGFNALFFFAFMLIKMVPYHVLFNNAFICHCFQLELEALHEAKFFFEIAVCALFSLKRAIEVNFLSAFKKKCTSSCFVGKLSYVQRIQMRMLSLSFRHCNDEISFSRILIA